MAKVGSLRLLSRLFQFTSLEKFNLRPRIGKCTLSRHLSSRLSFSSNLHKYCTLMASNLANRKLNSVSECKNNFCRLSMARAKSSRVRKFESRRRLWVGVKSLSLSLSFVSEAVGFAFACFSLQVCMFQLQDLLLYVPAFWFDFKTFRAFVEIS